jgi:hypothetical protein
MSSCVFLFVPSLPRCRQPKCSHKGLTPTTVTTALAECPFILSTSVTLYARVQMSPYFPCIEWDSSDLHSLTCLHSPTSPPALPAWSQLSSASTAGGGLPWAEDWLLIIFQIESIFSWLLTYFSFTLLTSTYNEHDIVSDAFIYSHGFFSVVSFFLSVCPS